MNDRVTPDVLDEAVVALRDVKPPDPVTIGATRDRVMASLDRGRGTRRRRVAVAAVLATLGTGTLSWAAATGRLEPVLQRIGLSDPPARPEVDPPVAIAERSKRVRAATPPAIAVEPSPSPTPTPPTPTPTPTPPPPTTLSLPPIPSRSPSPPSKPTRPTPSSDTVTDTDTDTDTDTALYRDAHAKHFHASDPAAAVAAWDRYLVAHPRGQLAVEARYNRGVALIRAKRLDDAAAALMPFARGEIEPAGYRKTDALRLLAAIGRSP